MKNIHNWINTGLIVLVAILVLVGGNSQSVTLGGSTSDDWNVGGNLSVTGTSSLTGNMSVTGASDAGTLTQGGGVTATSTVGAVVPLLASNFDIENTIDVTLNVSDATLSFPATSTLASIIPNTGDSRTLFIRNATTTAAMDLTITGGTGVLLKKATTTPIIYGDTDGANYAKVDLIRKANTDIEALLTIFMD